MSAAAAALQRAIHAVLTGDAALTALLGGPDVFDHTPPSAAFPYVTYGQTTVSDWATSTEPGSEIRFSLHVWSRQRGRSEALAIMEALKGLVDGAALSVAGHHLVNLTLETSETGYDDDIAVHHGSMRFRAVLEPVA